MILYVRLQEVLDERGITQKQLSEMTKLRPTTISELCNNVRTTINRDHLVKVAVALEIERVEDLLEFRKARSN
ncbi:helix-turn-helix domain-containing protein [Brevibacillus panacihumi]|uniref:helix-turn-helix domain-containing protein n=1 Tax=Brevibacillus panacihumi TaxID=497735 RepID=UPI003D037DF2